MNWLAAKLIAALVGAVVTVASASYMRTLRGELAHVSRQLDDARQHIADRDNTIQRVKRQAAKKATQQARLGQAQDAIASKLAASQLENRRLIDENAVLRAWADMRLPDDVVRLQTSPVFTGADDYLGRVSSGEPMHATGDSAANQR